ncbi:phenylalanyl-tRNA synthetase alpha subunit [Elusimicrobium posterum]
MNLNEWKDSCTALAAQYTKTVSEAKTLEELEAARVAALGRKGALTELLKALKDFSLEDKKTAGPLGNDLKKTLEAAFETKEKEISLAKLNETLAQTNIDLTLPGTFIEAGHKHPLSIALERMTTVLSKLGFVWTEGPQIEEEKYNFDFLNIPAHHPARDVQDTLFIGNSAKKGMVLRTHTSNVQARYMEKNKPPLRIMSPAEFLGVMILTLHTAPSFTR